MKNRNSILFCIALAFASACSKSDNSTTINATPTDDYKVTFKLDGVPVTYQSASAGSRNGVSSSLSLRPYPDTSNGTYISFFSQSNPTKYFYIEKGRLFFTNGSTPQKSVFNSYFSPGNFLYQFDSSVSKRDGIIIKFQDENQVTWSSSSGAQDNSANFSITSSTEKSGMGETFLRVGGTFNCKIFDGKGNSKVITEGNYFAAFENM